MPIGNPLLRSFVQKTAGKSFFDGLSWGLGMGVISTQLFYVFKIKTRKF